MSSKEEVTTKVEDSQEEDAKVDLKDVEDEKEASTTGENVLKKGGKGDVAGENGTDTKADDADGEDVDGNGDGNGDDEDNVFTWDISILACFFLVAAGHRETLTSSLQGALFALNDVEAICSKKRNSSYAVKTKREQSSKGMARRRTGKIAQEQMHPSRARQPYADDYRQRRRIQAYGSKLVHEDMDAVLLLGYLIVAIALIACIVFSFIFTHYISFWRCFVFFSTCILLFWYLLRPLSFSKGNEFDLERLLSSTKLLILDHVANGDENEHGDDDSEDDSEDDSHSDSDDDNRVQVGGNKMVGQRNLKTKMEAIFWTLSFYLSKSNDYVGIAGSIAYGLHPFLNLFSFCIFVQPLTHVSLHLVGSGLYLLIGLVCLLTRSNWNFNFQCSRKLGSSGIKKTSNDSNISWRDDPILNSEERVLDTDEDTETEDEQADHLLPLDAGDIAFEGHRRKHHKRAVMVARSSFRRAKMMLHQLTRMPSVLLHKLLQSWHRLVHSFYITIEIQALFVSFVCAASILIVDAYYEGASFIGSLGGWLLFFSAFLFILVIMSKRAPFLSSFHNVAWSISLVWCQLCMVASISNIMVAFGSFHKNISFAQALFLCIVCMQCCAGIAFLYCLVSSASHLQSALPHAHVLLPFYAVSTISVAFYLIQASFSLPVPSAFLWMFTGASLVCGLLPIAVMVGYKYTRSWNTSKLLFPTKFLPPNQHAHSTQPQDNRGSQKRKEQRVGFDAGEEEGRLVGFLLDAFVLILETVTNIVMGLFVRHLHIGVVCEVVLWPTLLLAHMRVCKRRDDVVPVDDQDVRYAEMLGKDNNEVDSDADGTTLGVTMSDVLYGGNLPINRDDDGDAIVDIGDTLDIIHSLDLKQGYVEEEDAHEHKLGAEKGFCSDIASDVELVSVVCGLTVCGHVLFSSIGIAPMAGALFILFGRSSYVGCLASLGGLLMLVVFATSPLSEFVTFVNDNMYSYTWWKILCVWIVVVSKIATSCVALVKKVQPAFLAMDRFAHLEFHVILLCSSFEAISLLLHENLIGMTIATLNNLAILSLGSGLFLVVGAVVVAMRQSAFYEQSAMIGMGIMFVYALYLGWHAIWVHAFVSMWEDPLIEASDVQFEVYWVSCMLFFSLPVLFVMGRSCFVKKKVDWILFLPLLLLIFVLGSSTVMREYALVLAYLCVLQVVKDITNERSRYA
eukprot:m.94584 g.94584  ORF g.94584 m.94584 type:complete len:1186 (-) comp8925_c0_seq1:674-4231(-)